MSCSTPFEISVEEAFPAGSLTMQSGKENRVREYWIKEVRGCAIQPHDIVGNAIVVDGPKAPAVGDPFDGLPLHGGGVVGAVGAAQRRENGELVPGHILQVRRVTYTSVQPSLLKCTAIYADNQTDWAIKRGIETTTKSETTYYDLDSNDQPPPGGAGGPYNGLNGCYDFWGLLNSQFASGPSTALINGADGTSTEVPSYTLTLRGLYYDMAAVALPGAARDTATLSPFAIDHPLFGVGNSEPLQWKFIGVTGDEVKVDQSKVNGGKDVWNLTWKFQYDPFYHRSFHPLWSIGGKVKVPDLGTTGGDPMTVLPCRSARRHAVGYWSDWFSYAVQ